MVRVLALGLTLALALSACAAPRARASSPPVRDAEPAPAPTPPPPLPETAFRGDDERAPRAEAPATRARFETRRIGEAPPAGPRYRGAPVDLDVKGADLADVFRLLSEVGRTNIVVSGDVTGTITLRLRRVPWDQALDVVARTHGLVTEHEGNIILVRRADAPRAAR